MNVKTEIWNGHKIRFVEKEPGDWWAVAADIAKALEYRRIDSMLRKLKPSQKDTHLMSTLGGQQEVSIISETGIYKVITRSRKKEAEQFEDWIFTVIKTLRQASGLEGFQIFRMLDKEHQREAMSRLKAGLVKPVRVDFIKANTIANKAVSSIHGYPKMLKKGDMSPDMLIQRQQILDDTVNLMNVNQNFGLGLSVSKAVYSKYRY
ncbi:BRO domain protein [Desulforamulus reducens MI-1]|uniref:BRO domain protein n=1 Tax=Desulforamulus reducens (strain ATCC BAA-1160 / DSM 100696 / MI-1) TaxID=349161 RepID=A4J7S9_DESRM|nr:phage repressor protein [Desulforamulus reducens]ABO51132.1 BRO domain protein [Desulforamulus reducens MI-1]